MSYFLFIILAGVVIIFVGLFQHKAKNKQLTEFIENNKIHYATTVSQRDEAINIRSLSDRTLGQKIEDQWHNVLRQVGNKPILKITLYCLLLFVFSVVFNNQFIQAATFPIAVISILLGLWLGYQYLQRREQKIFEESFPNALNMMTSAVSAGDSIMHAIIHVGNNLSGTVGEEFKLMGKRLQLGEDPDDVFRKSCRRFPYRTFQFFVITLRANLQRGGQLKEVMSKLNRIMFNARAMGKKKNSMTAEARISAKIVAAIPFIFLLIMRYLSPENFEYVMTNPTGQMILYYMLISEFIGIGIIWLLMKGVR